MTVKYTTKGEASLTGDTVLWRYIDAPKFFDLLHNQTLYFSRGDQFQDKFEGAFTKSLEHAISSAYKADGITFEFSEFKKRLRQRVFVNCWHASIDDSMAMWGLYGRSSCAVAITTTVDQLQNALQGANIGSSVSIKKVQYVKHWRDPKLNINPYSNVFAYKVKAYEFEKEVRAIIDRFDDDIDAVSLPVGISVVVKLDELLRSIVVAPEAPPWFLSLVEGVVQKYAIEVPVRRTKLALDPI